MRKENTNNIVFGTRAILETIESGKEIDKVLIQKGLSNELTKQLVKTMKGYQVPFSTVPIEKLNRVTRKNHQGAIAFISSIQYASLDNVINDDLRLILFNGAGWAARKLLGLPGGASLLPN